MAFDIKGIWKGEYAEDDRFEPSVIKTSVPFILKIKSAQADGLFEGICQDDPVISQIDFHADVFGKLEGIRLAFSKRYPKTILRDNFGKLVIMDQSHPDVVYYAELSDKRRVLGSWKIERTFRKVGNNVIEIGPTSGVWWMERF